MFAKFKSSQFYLKWQKSLLILMSPDILPGKLTIRILALIILFIFSIRLYMIRWPLLEQTVWKEIDYITISKNYWQNGYNFFHPEIFWPADPPRYTAMEFPLVPYMASFLYNLGGINFYSVRIITLLAFLLQIIFLFKLSRVEFGPLIAIFSALFIGLFPLNHPFGKFLFSEPLMIAFSIMAIYFLSKWTKSEKMRDLIYAGIFLSLAISLKLTPLYLFIPVTWLFYNKYRNNLSAYKMFLIFSGFVLILPILWYAYAYYLTKHSIDVFGIFQGHNKFQTFTMLTSLNWYRSLASRIASQIMAGKVFLVFVFIGVVTSMLLKKGVIFQFYLASIISFFIIVAEGQLDAPYRQLTIIPLLAVFLTIGLIAILLIPFSFINRPISSRLLFRCSFIFLIIIGLYHFISKVDVIFDKDESGYKDRLRWDFSQSIKKFTHENSRLVIAGEYTIHVGGNDLSPVLYYYTGLRGWTIQQHEWQLNRIDELIQKGATNFIAIEMQREPEANDFILLMKKKYRILVEDKEKDILLLDLLKKNEGLDI